MAVVTVKSGAITNRDATPQVHNNPIIDKGVLRELTGFVTITAGDTSTSVYLFGQLPSNCRVSQILLYSDDCGSVTTADFGLYDTTLNGGAAVSSALFATIVDIHSGALNAVDITHEAAVSVLSDIDGVEKFLWQELGLSADPCKHYDFAMTLHATCDIGGRVMVKVRYVV